MVEAINGWLQAVGIRLESFVTRNGAFAFGALPEVDDLQAPIYHLGFPTGLGPRVEDILATAIRGFYLSPYEDLTLRRA